MRDETKGITTRELWAKLFQAPSIEHFLEASGGSFTMPSFADYITELCNARDKKPERIINGAGIERSFGHRLFAGTRNPSRDTVLQLAFGFELSPDETQQLLKVAHMTQLHPKVKRDAVIAYCLHKGASFVEAQQALHDNDLPLLGGRRNG